MKIGPICLSICLMLAWSCRSKVNVASSSAESGETDGAADDTGGGDQGTPDDGQDPDGGIPSGPKAIDAKFVVNDDAQTSASRSVVLKFLHPKGIGKYRVADWLAAQPCNASAEFGPWTTPKAPEKYRLSSGDGLVTVCVEAVATDGVKHAFASDTITLDTTAPALATLTSGLFTNARAVAFDFDDPSTSTHYRIGFGPTCATAAWQPMPTGTSTGTFELPDADGPYSVCLQTRDGSGNLSPVQVEDIVLDRALPTASIATTGSLGPGFSPTDTLSIAGTASDSSSGLASLRVQIRRSDDVCLTSNQTFGGACPIWLDLPADSSAWSVPVPVANLANAQYEITLETQDRASNVVTDGPTQFTWYVPPPIALISGAPTTKSRTETFSLAIGGVGVATYRSKYGAASSTQCDDLTDYGSYVDASTPIEVDLTAIVDGPVVVCALARDVDSNEQDVGSPSVATWTKDMAPPALAIATPTTLTIANAANHRALTVSGTCDEEGGSIVAAIGSLQSQGDCTAGNYSVVLDLLTVPDGSVALDVSSTDEAANTTTASVTFVKDVAAPAAATVSDIPTGQSNALSITGTVGGAEIASYKYALVTGGAATCAGATYSSYAAVSVPLAETLGVDAIHQLCVIGRDSAGNEQASPSTYSWTKDTDPPANATLAGTPGNPSTATALSVDVQGTNIATYRFKILGGSAADCSSGAYGTSPPATTNITDTLGADDTYRLCVVGSDAAGNEQTTPTSFSWTKDTTPPSSATLSGTPSDPSVATALNVDVFGADLVSYKYKILSASAPNCSSGSYGSLLSLSTKITNSLSADDTYRLCVVGVDAAGNEQAAPTSFSWTKDTTAPASATLVGAPANPSSVTTTSIDVQGIDIASYKFKILSGSSTDCTGGTYGGFVAASVDITEALGGDGTYRICVIGRDAAGNEQVTATTNYWEKDTVAPVNATLSGTPSDPSNASALDVSVNGSDVSSFKFKILAAGASDCTSGTYGSFVTAGTKISDALGTDDTYRLCVIGRDAAGNEQSSPSTFAWTKDTNQPANATLAGTPNDPSNAPTLDIDVQGADIVSYKYKILNAAAANCGGGTYGAFVAATVNITDTLGGDDTYRVCVIGRDAAGNEQATATTYAWQKNTTAAANAVLANTPANPSNDTALDVDVQGATITSYKYKLLGNDAPDCSGGTYGGFVDASVNIADVLAVDDGYRLCVIGRDAAGNEQTSPTTYSWTRDTAAPGSATLSGTPVDPSNLTTLDVDVQGADIAQYKFKILGGSAANCTSGSYGSFVNASTNITEALGGDDTFRLCVIGRDAAGNEQISPTSYAWTKDTAPPASATLSGAPANVSNATTLNVDVQGSGITSYKYKLLDGSPADCSGGSYGSFIDASTNITGSIGSDGGYRLCVIGRDAAGNEQLPATFHAWTKDTVPPAAATLANAPSNPSNVTALDVDVQGADIVDYKFKILSNAADCSGGSYGSFIDADTNIDDTVGVDATYRLCVVGRDAAGNEQASPTTLSWVKDTTPPASATLAGTPGDPSNASALDVDVQGANIDSYKFKILGAAATDCSSGSYGSFIDVDTNIDDALGADDTYRLCVIGRDTAGNEQTSPTTYSWTKDTSPPAAATLAGTPADPSNLTALDVDVQGANITSYKFKILGGGAATCSGGSYGTFIDADTNIDDTLGADDTYRLCVIGRDAAGNEQSSPTTHSWVKDTVVPAAATLVGTPSSPSKSTALDVDVQGASIASYKYKILGGGAASCTGGSYSSFIDAGTDIEDALGGDDTYRLCVIGRDAAGNEQSTATSFSWTKDTLAPGDFDFTAPGSYSVTATPTVTWSAAAGASAYALLLDGNSDCSSPEQSYPSETGTSKLLTTLSDGTHYLCLHATDAATNIKAATSNPRMLVVDTQAPTTPGSPADAGTYSGPTVTFTWSASTDSGPSGLSGYRLQVGTSAGASDVLDQNVGDVLTYDVAGTDGNTYYARVKAVDSAGNESAFSGNSNGVMVDETAPTGASNVRIAADASGDASASYDNDLTIFLTWDAGSDGQSGLHSTAPYQVTWYATNNCSGASNVVASTTSTHVSLTSPSVVDGGFYSFKVRTQDNAANTTTSGCSNAIKIDTTFPPALDGFSGATGSAVRRVDLSLNLPSDVSDYAEIRLYRSAPSASTGGSAPSCGSGTLATTITNFATDPTLYTDDTGAAGKYFSYRACIYDLAGNLTSSNTVTDRLSKSYTMFRYYDAADINGDGTPNSGDVGSSSTTTWTDITGTTNATLGGFNFNTSTSGWDGDGTPSDPYRLKFDGSDDYLSTGTTGIMTSFAAWIKVDSACSYCTVIARSGSGGYAIMVNNLQLAIGWNNNGTTTHATTAMAADTWTHVAATHDGTNLSVYVDGLLLGKVTTGASSMSGTLYVGRIDWAAQNFFRGEMANIKLFSQSLTQDDVVSMWAEERSRFFAPSGNFNVLRLSQMTGSTGGGTSILALGENLNSETTTFEIGDVAGTASATSSNSLLLTTPAGSAGARTFELVSGADSFATPNGWIYTSTSLSSIALHLEANNINTLGASGDTASDSVWWPTYPGSPAARLYNFTLPQSNGTSGWVGTAEPYALQFDGANDYVNAGSFRPSEIKTISIWFKTDTSCTYCQLYQLEDWEGVYLNAGTVSASSGGQAKTTSFTAGAWQHFAMTQNGSTIKFFLNGTSFASYSGTTSTSDRSFFVGRVYWGNQNFFDGAIGSIKAWRTTMTDTDVSNLYNAELPIYQ